MDTCLASLTQHSASCTIVHFYKTGRLHDFHFQSDISLVVAIFNVCALNCVDVMFLYNNECIKTEGPDVARAGQVSMSNHTTEPQLISIIL